MAENVRILTEEITPYLDAAKFEFVVSNLPLVRASRIRSPKNPEDRARRLAAEVALRRLLREVGEDYRALTIAYTETGKPYFEGRRDLTFSLSHSGRIAAAALIQTPPGETAPEIGVDVEALPRGERAERYLALAERFFSPGFLSELRAASPEEAPRVFGRLWCLTEAAVKATGSGALDFKAAEGILKTARSRETRFLSDAFGTDYALACVVTGGAE